MSWSYRNQEIPAGLMEAMGEFVGAGMKSEVDPGRPPYRPSAKQAE